MNGYRDHGEAKKQPVPDDKIPAKSKRADIPSRPTDGDLRRDRVKNKDPERDYVFVDPRLEQFGVGDYMSLGYAVEKRRAGGPRPEIEPPDVVDGAEIRQMGTVLMSRSKAVGQREFKAQQDYADEIDKKILKPGGVDGLRGLSGYIGVRNTSSTLERDVEE